MKSSPRDQEERLCTSLWTYRSRMSKPTHNNTSKEPGYQSLPRCENSQLRGNKDKRKLVRVRPSPSSELHFPSSSSSSCQGYILL